MDLVDVHRGPGPLVLGVPHAGLLIPDRIYYRLNPIGQARRDTDWYVDRLYEGLAPAATMVKSNVHRYVIDANRDPSGTSLYRDQNTTGLCPVSDFTGQPIYLDGESPSATEIESRLAEFHAPYHRALAAELTRVRAQHGVAILYDCHSIRSPLPYLFDGELPDFNVGTVDGTACAEPLEDAVVAVIAAAEGFRYVVNGRFKGGWTVRHHGRPTAGVHAVQMELSQATYLRICGSRFEYDEARAETVRPHLSAVLRALENLAKTLPRGKETP